MTRTEAIRNIFFAHKYRLLITYTLFSLEMLGTLLRPFFLGNAVNDLIAGSYQGLIILSAQHLAWLLIGTVRHMYDTRTYTAIYTSLVTRLLSNRSVAASVSKLSAHSTLAREFVDFLEYDLVYIIEALFNLLGSIVLLFFYNRTVIVLCLAVLLPVMAISYIYGKKMSRLTKEKNDELEKQVDIINEGDPESMKAHYKSLRRWQVKISDQEAWNFGLMELLVLVVITGSLLLTTHVKGEVLLAGDLIGIYNYVLKFISGLDTIPYIVQRFSTLSDISGRMEVRPEGTYMPIANPA